MSVSTPLILQVGNLRACQEEGPGVRMAIPGSHSCLPSGTPHQPLCPCGEGRCGGPLHCIPPASCNLGDGHSPRVGVEGWELQ